MKLEPFGNTSTSGKISSAVLQASERVGSVMTDSKSSRHGIARFMERFNRTSKKQKRRPTTAAKPRRSLRSVILQRFVSDTEDDARHISTIIGLFTLFLGIIAASVFALPHIVTFTDTLVVIVGIPMTIVLVGMMITGVVICLVAFVAITHGKEKEERIDF